MAKDKAPSIIYSVLNNKCPYCRKGDMFVERNPFKLNKTLTMNQHCPNCGGNLEPEVGFYFGTGYISYGLSIALFAVWFALYYLLFGISIYDNSLFIYLGTAIVLVLIAQPPMMRLSRSIWIAIFQPYKGETAN